MSREMSREKLVVSGWVSASTDLRETGHPAACGETAVARGGESRSPGGGIAITRAEGGRGGAPGAPRGVLRPRSRRAYETRLPHPRARPRDFADLRLAAVMRSRRTMGRAVPTNPPPRDLPAVQRRKDKHPMASKTKPVLFTVRLLRRPIPRLPKGGLATPTTTWGVCSLRTSSRGACHPPNDFVGRCFTRRLVGRRSRLPFSARGLERLATPYRE